MREWHDASPNNRARQQDAVSDLHCVPVDIAIPLIGAAPIISICTQIGYKVRQTDKNCETPRSQTKGDDATSMCRESRAETDPQKIRGK